RALEKGQRLPDTAIRDIEAALSLGESAALHRDAAIMYACSDKSVANFQKMLRCLRLAVECGVDPDSIRSEHCFEEYKELPEFTDIVNSPWTLATLVKLPRYVDPLPD